MRRPARWKSKGTRTTFVLGEFAPTRDAAHVEVNTALSVALHNWRFPAAATGKPHSISLHLDKLGAPTGDLVVRLYSDAGAQLKQSSTVSRASLTAGAGAGVGATTLTFSVGSTELVMGTFYRLRLINLSDGGTVDGGNFGRCWGKDSTFPTDYTVDGDGGGEATLPAFQLLGY